MSRVTQLEKTGLSLSFFTAKLLSLLITIAIKIIEVEEVQ